MKNLRVGILHIVFIYLPLLLLSPQQLLQAKTPLEIAKSYVGVKEKTGNNDGKEVELFLKSVGLGKGYSWCAAFVSYCIKNSNSNYRPLSAVAQKFITKKSIKAEINTKLDSGIYVAVWKRGATPYGHIGIVEKQEANIFHTIEGNTSAGAKGSQSNGDGVYRRKRKIEPYNYLRITHFTEI